MKVQALEKEDLKLIADLQPDGWSNIIPNYDFYIKSSFCFPIKVLVNDDIVGIGATIIHHEVAWLGHVIVHSAHRGKGIGKDLTQTLIDIGHQHNCETIYLMATELGAPVYSKLGFVTDTEYLFFKDISVDLELLNPDRIVSYKPEFKSQISSIDHVATGEDRMMHLEGELENGFVYVNNDKIEGFYLPSFGYGLVVANDALAGLELLKLHLKSHDKVAFPKENVSATDFLYHKGFKEYDAAKRMRLGKVRPYKLQNLYNRVAGNIG